MMPPFVGHAVGAGLCIAAMFGANVYVRPVIETRYEEREYVQPTGTLHVRRRGDTSETPLMTTHILTRDIERLGRVYQVRELLLRSASPSQQTASLELYIDLSRVNGDLLSGSHDPGTIVQSELQVLPMGRLGAKPSFILLGDATPRRVITGTLLLTEVTMMQEGDKSVYRTAGRLEMQVDSGQGVEMITGRLEGQISWDPTGA
ncbi:MAG: hypothetical protein RL701_7953 [Pseudomonadota bacterium]|jgi:hypothetical protein